MWLHLRTRGGGRRPPRPSGARQSLPPLLGARRRRARCSARRAACRCRCSSWSGPPRLRVRSTATGPARARWCAATCASAAARARRRARFPARSRCAASWRSSMTPSARAMASASAPARSGRSRSPPARRSIGWSVPPVDVHFETNVPGLYIVGELGGRGLIKNAVNEGKMAVEHIVAMLPPGAPRADATPAASMSRLSGRARPASAPAIEAMRCGLTYVVLEQGSLADSIRKYPRHKLLLAEPVQIPLYGDLWVADASKESLLQVWETIVANTGLAGDAPSERSRASCATAACSGSRPRPATYLRAPGGAGDGTARHAAQARRAGRGARQGVLRRRRDGAVRRAARAGGRRRRQRGGVGGRPRQPDGHRGARSRYRGETFARIKDAQPREARPRGRQPAGEAAASARTVREIRPDVVVLDRGGESMIVPNDFVVIRDRRRGALRRSSRRSACASCRRTSPSRAIRRGSADCAACVARWASLALGDSGQRRTRRSRPARWRAPCRVLEGASNCTKCHGASARARWRRLCLDCHKEVRWADGRQGRGAARARGEGPGK